MKVSIVKPILSDVVADTLVLGIWQDGQKLTQDPILAKVDQLSDGVVARFLAKNKKFGKVFDLATLHISPKKHKKIEKIVIVGLGKPKDLDNYKIKQVAASIGKQLRKDTDSVSIHFPKKAVDAYRVGLMVNGFILGTFDSGHHKTEEREQKKIESLAILTDLDLSKSKESAQHGLMFGEVTNKIREIVNLPANICTPDYMVKFARRIASDNKLKIDVFSEKQVNEMGMNIMASVAKGSEEDLYFVVLKYQPTGVKKTLVLVGKGITFDSGGISIKPSESMEWMKMDMAGAAAVFGAMEIIAKLAPKINVVAAVPLTENLPSGKASKPGDVVKGLSGKTVEIINTDAEGRLVLADALTYVQKNCKPDYIVDVATLTGAVGIALGNWATGIMGRPQGFCDQAIKAADQSGERVWQLPLYDEYKDQFKSYIADIANFGGKLGGAETAAKFLEEFVDEKIPWVHLDIASTAWEENEKPYQPKGATGIAVATLVNLALNLGK